MPRPKRQDVQGPFYDEIYGIMRQRGWEKLEDFADHFGIGRTTVYSLVLGRKNPDGSFIKPSLETVVRLALALNKPLDYFVERVYPDIELPKAIPFPLDSVVKVPIIGLLGAGPGEEEEADGLISVPAEFALGKNLVGYRIRGDSMCGGKRPICSGDEVLVNKLDKGQSGAIVAARLIDGSHVCKALKIDKFGKRLMSLNPLYTNSAPPIIKADMVAEVIGSVVFFQGPVENLES